MNFEFPNFAYRTPSSEYIIHLSEDVYSWEGTKKRKRRSIFCFWSFDVAKIVSILFHSFIHIPLEVLREETLSSQ